jgi:hypothetical protein
MLSLSNKFFYILFFFIIGFDIVPEDFIVTHRIYIHYNGNRVDLVAKIVDELQHDESYFFKKYNYKPEETVDIKLTTGLNEMQELLKMPAWIGVYYFDFKMYLQPPEMLFKNGSLTKVIFIGYSHYFIDSYTNSKCPEWMNEALSDYFYSIFSSEKNDPNFKPVKLVRFGDYANLRINLPSYPLANEFYRTSIRLFSFLNSRYGNDFCDRLLSSLRDGKNTDEIFLKLAGKTIENIYENEFVGTQQNGPQGK